MKRVLFLFAVVSLTSMLGCASSPPPPPIGPTPAETAAMQELNQETANQNPPPAQPAPQE
jgi:hypothetical protein